MRALVRPVHQLADAGGGGRDDAGRQRGGKDIGAADEPQNLELRMVGDAEAADGADALAKGPDNEIDVADHALRLGDAAAVLADEARSEEHTSELQSLMRISYAVFCLKKKNNNKTKTRQQI